MERRPICGYVCFRNHNGTCGDGQRGLSGNIVEKCCEQREELLVGCGYLVPQCVENGRTHPRFVDRKFGLRVPHVQVQWMTLALKRFIAMSSSHQPPAFRRRDDGLRRVPLPASTWLRAISIAP